MLFMGSSIFFYIFERAVREREIWASIYNYLQVRSNGIMFHALLQMVCKDLRSKEKSAVYHISLIICLGK